MNNTPTTEYMDFSLLITITRNEILAKLLMGRSLSSRLIMRPDVRRKVELKQKCVKGERVCCVHLNNDRLPSESVNTWNYYGLNWTRIILFWSCIKRQMETWRLLHKPIKNTDLARQRYTELRNMTHTCTSMVQMDCFKVRRINKNVLNTLKIQSGT